MATYTIKARDMLGEVLAEIEADSHEDAAMAYAKKKHRSRRAAARRATGTVGKSGCFFVGTARSAGLDFNGSYQIHVS